MFDYDFYLWVLKVWAIYFLLAICVLVEEWPFLAGYTKPIVKTLAVSSITMVGWSTCVLIKLLVEAYNATN